MQRKFTLTVILTCIVAAAGYIIYDSFQETDVEELRAVHQEYLDNSKFKETQLLSKEERKALGLPPNAYYEQMYELMMDPASGRPTPEKLLLLQQELMKDRDGDAQRGVGGDGSNPWIDRGPNNIGGRTRGLIFDPNDVGNANPDDDYTRVITGGVSGGIWVNDDITDPNSSWQLLSGAPNIVAVNQIIVDPNDSDVFYIASGESYTGDQAVGNGIWKSTDAGVTWANILGGYTGFTGTEFVDGIFYVNDIIARDIGGGNTELYAAIAGGNYSVADNPNNFMGLSEQGLYKSTDDGASWTRINLTETNGTFINPCDLELDINNNIWLSTTRSNWGFNGSRIFRSTDGVTFDDVGRISTAGRRTELEPSPTDANLMYVAMQLGGGANLYTLTYDSGTNSINVTQNSNEPNDVDNGIPANDYTRGQAFYDLPIEINPANGDLYVGGINLFRSTDDGTTWIQASKWSNNNNLANLDVPLVHADQHGMFFRPGAGNENEVVFTTDGGVYYSDDITQADDNIGDTNAIEPRKLDYNTIQFYYGDIADNLGATADDDLIGGTQDNGTLRILDGAAGANSAVDITGGDGGFTEIDDNAAYILSAYPGNTHYVRRLLNNSFYPITQQGGGSFINTAGLDDNLDILYVNASGGTAAIERTANWANGPGGIQSTLLTNVMLDQRPSAFKVSPFTTTSTTLFAGLINGKLIRITNADTTPVWTEITTPFVGSVSDIEFGQNEDEIFVTMHNYNTVNVWFTSDGGTNWENKEGNLPDLPVKCILQNPLIPQELIIGTELGVWATADYTVTSPVWVQTQNGMLDVTVRDLDVRASDNVILATTHGRGFFTSQFTSSPLSVNEFSIAENTISVIPTVSDGNFKIKTSRALGEVSLQLFSISGQRVFEDRFEFNMVDKTYNLNLDAGMYLLTIENGQDSITKRLIIE